MGGQGDDINEAKEGNEDKNDEDQLLEFNRKLAMQLKIIREEKRKLEEDEKILKDIEKKVKELESKIGEKRKNTK